jgi:mono/diheme cytochrome c family protein
MKWLLTALLIGCGSPRMSEAVVGKSPELNAEESRGELVFMRKCNMCHPQGEGGLGGQLNAKPFPGTMIKAKVRGLVPGDMPKFGDEDIPDADVDAVAAYLKRIRKNDND